MNDLEEKNVIESVELVARIVRSCREKMDASNRLSPRGISTPGALFPLLPRDHTDIFVVSPVLCPKGDR